MEQKDTIPVICSNLAKAAEKQQNPGMAAEYSALAEKYDDGKPSAEDLAGLKTLITEDLTVYPDLQKAAESAGDRGAQRALRWGQKVTAIQKSLIDRFLSKGDALLDGKGLFVCEACGFIFLGDSAPDICPVCKAPVSRFSKV
ncbi:MAG: rubredoxin [Spirochaetales bacterium]|uniref:Rubredoxin n=1 Tax=Candidatus Thalassospirochaeta sargassi TaxID=3119039 RepID=A0AAJ1ILC6_9SPIO|nr:rubredoxin [Spirochaetales bacterium]